MAQETLTIAKALERARDAHGSGNFQEAERLYRAILQVQPSNAAAHNNLAVLAVGVGKPVEALPHFEAALQAAPRHPAIWKGYIGTLVSCRRIREARRALEKARHAGLDAAALKAIADGMPIDPSAEEARPLLEAFEARSFTALEQAARLLTESHPFSPFGWKSLGLALLSMGRTEEALVPLRHSLELNSNDPEVHTYLGDAQRSVGQLAGSEASFKKALDLKPDSVATRVSLASLLLTMERYAEAEQHFRRAAEASPHLAVVHTNLGTALRHLDRFDEAEACFRRAAELDPDKADYHYNLGNFLRDANRYEEAEKPFRRAIAIDGNHLHAINNLAEILTECGRFAEARDHLQSAIERRPDYATARWNKSLLDLRLGNFAEGWRGYEWRWRYHGFPTPRRDLAQPLWLGDEPIAGRTIAIHWEQGLGDTIQFCRYLPMLAAQGAKVLFAPQRPLHGLMKRLSGIIELVDLADIVDGRMTFDCQAPLMSLPLAFKTDLAGIPNAVPYLSAEPDRVARWKEQLGREGFRIGICWQGRAGKVDRGRSFPVSDLGPIAHLPQVRLISLHKGEGLAQLANLPAGMRVETLGEEFDSGPDAFLDTAAVMKLCDLVITSDTAIAHLAGALGVRTWVALKQASDWRWLVDRHDSPWYPTLRLFRQRTRGQWGSVFEEIERELSALLGSALVEEESCRTDRR